MASRDLRVTLEIDACCVILAAVARSSMDRGAEVSIGSKSLDSDSELESLLMLESHCAFICVGAHKLPIFVLFRGAA